MAHGAPRLKVREVRLFERDFTLRLPFRFGVVTLTEAIQGFARVRVQLEDGREGWGMAAEVLAPKWFDKDSALSNDDNVDQLRAAVAIARDRYLDADAGTAFSLYRSFCRQSDKLSARNGLNRLVLGFGPALLDRAVLDALCRIEQVSFYDAIRRNLPGVAASDDVAPDLREVDLDSFLAALAPAESVHARHTVGMVDPITAADQPAGSRVDDGLPETLEEVSARYGNRYYKLKVGGNLDQDIARLGAIAAVLDRLPEPYRATLDGNEQYDDVAGVVELWRAIESTPSLRRLADSILFIEQPLKRSVALESDVGALAAARPVIIDESDDDIESFAIAARRGYRGVSSKTCKGFYKSLVNAARCRMWNRRDGDGGWFMSAEDLTTQAGVCVQQDLALIGLLGITHVERNGHHYVNGMAGLPAGEQRAFFAAHPDLYHQEDGVVRLRIAQGRIAIASLGCHGFASAAEPDWTAMREMPRPGPIGGSR